MVLLLSNGKIDRLAIDEGKLAMNDGRADGASNGGEHLGKESLHENDLG